ncbi:MAG: wax ester/triacylglycerol synthase family O-acyltransferase [Myxococcota bacterium]|nr:wax ester/triacylglycerol synthase family O-acyltransferase [Myxococcota bacterium]
MARYHYERLSTESASHLMIEDSRVYAHAVSIMVFDRAGLQKPDGGLDVDEITRGIEARLHLAPRFRQRLKWVPYEDHPGWVDDTEFKLDYHVRHTALPFPGGDAQLRKLAARLMSSRLHRSRPMWECWVVEGLANDQFALIGKVHNCMIEDDSGADLFQALLSPDESEPFSEPPPFTPRPTPSGLELVRDEVWRRFRLPQKAYERMRALSDDSDTLRHQFWHRVEGAAKLLGYSVVPQRRTPINGRIGPHRRLHTLVVPLDRLQEIHRAFDCTVHDVMLAMVSGAIRRFFEAQLVHPASFDLRVATPVQKPGEAGRDEIAEWVIDLPIWERDPSKTVDLVREQTREQYQTHPALGARTLFSVARWTGSRLMALGARSLSNHTPVHTSLVNVPGSQDPLYFMGARLDQTYGVVPLRGEQGIAISSMSYDGKMCISINADSDLVPEVAEFEGALTQALEELLGAASNLGGNARPLRAVPSS